MFRDSQCYNLVRKVKNSWMPAGRWVQCKSMENSRSIHSSFYTHKPLQEKQLQGLMLPYQIKRRRIHSVE